MAKINKTEKSTKTAEAPAPVASAPKKTAEAPAATEAPVEGKKKRPTPKGTRFERARGVVVRSNTLLAKASAIIAAIAPKLAEDAEYKTQLGESAEALTEAAQWFNIAITKLMEVPSGHEFPAVKPKRSSGGGGGGALVVGMRVQIQAKKAELWPIFEDGDDTTMTVASIIGDGKRVLCKLASGGRQVLPAAHLKPVV